MEPVTHTEAVELVFSGRVSRHGGYCEVPTSFFIEKMDVDMPALPNAAFYTRTGDSFAVIKEAGEACSYLVLSLEPSVWVTEKDFAEIQGLADALLKKLSTDPNLAPEKRVEVLQKSAMKVVENLFNSPSPENISRSVKVVGSFVYLLMKDPNAYRLLSKLSSHDPYTLRHSVGVSVHSIILAKKAGFKKEEDLVDVGVAGLLHDIGKTKVKPEIINKKGPLDDIEWEEMKQHAQAGYEILKDDPTVSERTKLAVWEHHEEREGTGYPKKMKLSDTDLFSRIVSICDIFNALTTDRSYSKARQPFEAFQLMRDKLSHKYDEKLFQELVKIYGGAL